MIVLTNSIKIVVLFDFGIEFLFLLSSYIFERRLEYSSKFRSNHSTFDFESLEFEQIELIRSQLYSTFGSPSVCSRSVLARYVR